MATSLCNYVAKSYYENQIRQDLTQRPNLRSPDRCPHFCRTCLPTGRCEKIFQEKESGAKADRQELQMLLRQIRKGDTVVVSKLVRFGRSLKDLITNVNLVHEKGADFVSLTEKIDTTTPSGKFMFA